tara:strand:+ start:382 stop:537 length:156 start_codon:yes stop_codon:yes gene_type:complete
LEAGALQIGVYEVCALQITGAKINFGKMAGCQICAGKTNPAQIKVKIFYLF